MQDSKSTIIQSDLIRNIISNISDAVIFTDKDGNILSLNEKAEEIISRKANNIKDTGYLFNFDICILDKNTDIISYSPITVALENTIPVIIEAKYEDSSGINKQYIIFSSIIKDNLRIILFIDKSGEVSRPAYQELMKANQSLTDKIKENDQLRAQAQSQAIRESLANRISNALRTSLEIDSILQTAVEEIGKTMGTDSTFLIQNIEGEKEGTISHEYISGAISKATSRIISIEEDFALQQVIDTQEATTGSHVEYINNSAMEKFRLIIPVIHLDKLFGLLILLRSNRRWHSEEINLVQSVADQVSISIRNAQLFEDIASKTTKISVLNEILKSINSSLHPYDVFHTIGREIRRLISFEKASIAIFEDKTRQVKLFARIKTNGEVDILHTGPLLTKGSAISWAIDNLKPILLNADEHKDFTDTTILRNSGIKSALIIPMIFKKQVSGIFFIGSSKENIYSEADVEIMTQIAGQIAIAVENAKLYWQTQTQALKETLINQIVSSIRKSLDLSEVLASTVREIATALDVDHCFFRYYQEQDDSYRLYEYPATPDNKTGTTCSKLINLIAGKNITVDKDIKIIKSGETDLPEELTSSMELLSIKSILLFPISTREPLSNKNIQVGTLGLCRKRAEKDWSSDDINLLKVLSDPLIVTINQARLFEQTQKQKLEMENTLQKLQEMQSQLIQSEKMAALGQLVAGVAHEINTPIGSINSNNAIFRKCREKLDQALKEEPVNRNKVNQLMQLLEDTIKINYIACDRINDIVKSLKNFARLDESELKKVDIHEGINSTLTLLRHELKGKVDIIKFFSDLPEIECYPNLLNQVLMNLLVNACQSIENKGTITLATKKVGQNIQISIKDTGCGIAEDNIKKVFDPGFTTKGVGVGTGMGLSISYQIIEKHKGQILVDSTLREGSTFTIVIPISQSISQKQP